ncbi:hypothetical protein [Chlamydiifrater volucris]|uniref:hypothetical protein n=1 Tax=Chlamydiifrater volucris TaxID=2681470 RepID=UPI001BCF2AF9|nr:hypothetical protein [Chlamydiifrater volucris]
MIDHLHNIARRTLYFSSLLVALSSLSGCQNHSHFRGVTVAERITSQKGSGVIFHPAIYPMPLPQYTWQSPHSQIITKHSFYCRGADRISEHPPFQDCKGLFSHGLPIKNGKEFINPQLIRSVSIIFRTFCKEHTITIEEGYSCKRHFLFKKSVGDPLHPKHLSGDAAILTILSSDPGSDNSPLFFIEKMLPELKKMYPKNSSTEHVFSSSPRHIKNKEISLTFEPLVNGVKVFIETSYGEDAVPTV